MKILFHLTLVQEVFSHFCPQRAMLLIYTMGEIIYLHLLLFIMYCKVEKNGAREREKNPPLDQWWSPVAWQRHLHVRSFQRSGLLLMLLFLDDKFYLTPINKKTSMYSLTLFEFGLS